MARLVGRGFNPNNNRIFKFLEIKQNDEVALNSATRYSREAGVNLLARCFLARPHQHQ